MKNTFPFVITISRQLGAGGAYIGQQLAKKLSIFYADREIIGQAARKLSVMEEELEPRDERSLSLWQFLIQSCACTPETSYIPPQITVPSDRELFKTESEIITRIAQEHSTVIIGRCGSYILREHPKHVSMFLHGDLSFRKSRIQKIYHVSENVAGKMIVQSDEERSQYHYKFTGKDWADARQYGLSVNTGRTGVDKTVDFILTCLELIKVRDCTS